MNGTAHDFLGALALVLCVAAVTTVLFQRLRQPVVLGYLLAGLIVGPHVPVPLVADAGVVQTLSELGVILLMFSLGLEFSVRSLLQVGPTAGITALVQCSLMVWLGFVTGRLFGWTALESVFAGAIIAISSTTIIAKAFDEQGVQGPRRALVVGILVVEDLVAILLMAALTAIASGSGLSASALALTVGRLALFLVGLVAVGLFVIPRLMRAILRLHRPETTVVASVGICFAVALLAQKAGYSVALGAFLAGSLVAESGEAKTVEHAIQPVRDVFAAIFFVSVGMLIDPRVIVDHWVAVAVLTLVVVAGKVVGVSVGAFLTGNGIRRSVQAGMSLAQIGEFSFIIAGLGLTLGATRDFLYPIAVAVSALTTLLTPWLIRAADPVADLVDRKLPKPLQTFAALYGSWLEQLRRAPKEETVGRARRRLVRLLVVDAAMLAALIIGASLATRRLTLLLAEHVSIGPAIARVAVLVGAVVIAIPFILGVSRTSRRLGLLLAEEALPVTDGQKLDLARAPRRAFVVALQLAVLLSVAIPLLALVQPFLPGWISVLVFAALLLVLAVAFWRSAANLQGHVRAGIQMLLEALASQSAEPHAVPDLEHVSEVLPGLGEPRAVTLAESSYAVGRTLAQLSLRGVTGATVLALHRERRPATLPAAHEELLAGDVLALAGTQEAIAAAEQLLTHGPAPQRAA